MSSRTQQKSLLRSLFYMIRDFGILAALYYAYPAFESRGLGGLFVWWNLTGKLQCPSEFNASKAELPWRGGFAMRKVAAHGLRNLCFCPCAPRSVQDSLCGACSSLATTVGTAASATISGSTTSVGTSAMRPSPCLSGHGRR